jgi:arylsulfatase A-like enzyme
VRELGLERDTIVVFYLPTTAPSTIVSAAPTPKFFNSHGGLRGRKGSFHEGGFRVPTLVAWPGRIAPGASHDRVTGFEDWLPTLLSLIGAETTIPAGLDGISFAPTLLGGTQPARPVPLS